MSFYASDPHDAVHSQHSPQPGTADQPPNTKVNHNQAPSSLALCLAFLRLYRQDVLLDTVADAPSAHGPVGKLQLAKELMTRSLCDISVLQVPALRTNAHHNLIDTTTSRFSYAV